MVFGVAWNMSEKPGTAAAIASIVIAYAVGAGVAMRMTRMPVGEATPAAKTAS